SANIGGVYEYNRTYSGEGSVYVPVVEEIQRRSMDFLIDYAFEAPKWLLDEEIISLINQSEAVNKMSEIQVDALNNILDAQRIARLIEWNARSTENSYTAFEMLDQLRSGLWIEIEQYEPIGVFCRNLQLAYLERLSYLMNEELPQTNTDASQSDIRPMVREQLQLLLDEVQQAQPNISERATQAHLIAVEARTKKLLKP